MIADLGDSASMARSQSQRSGSLPRMLPTLSIGSVKTTSVTLSLCSPALSGWCLPLLVGDAAMRHVGLVGSCSGSVRLVFTLVGLSGCGLALSGRVLAVSGRVLALSGRRLLQDVGDAAMRHVLCPRSSPSSHKLKASLRENSSSHHEVKSI